MQQKIILICEQCLSRNYNSFINTNTHSERLKLRKFCKICNKHTLHKETR